jgi:hypothetical protein
MYTTSDSSTLANASFSFPQIENLNEENELSTDGLDSCLMGFGTTVRRLIGETLPFSKTFADSPTLYQVQNLMSISVIAPQATEPAITPAPHHDIDPAIKKSDIAYVRSMWYLGNLVQESLSSPSSLSLPLANSPRHKESLIAAFRRLYKSFPPALTQLDTGVLRQQALTNPRGVRQNLFLTSNYFHCLMLLQASENDSAGVDCNVKLALEAAHEAIWAFFKLWSFFEAEAGVWWVFQHRAFEESLLMAHLLASQVVADGVGLDPIFAKAKEDIARMLELMERYGGNLEMHRERKEVLSEAFARIVV